MRKREEKKKKRGGREGETRDNVLKGRQNKKAGTALGQRYKARVLDGIWSIFSCTVFLSTRLTG